MDTLIQILKIAVPLVLAASLAEALVLTWRQLYRDGPAYNWRASGISVVDFLVREYLLRIVLPLAFWFGIMQWFWEHRLFTVPMDHWSGWLACFLVQEFCYYWYHRAAHRVRWFWCTHSIHHSPNELNLSAAYRFGWTGKLSGTLLFFMLAPLFGLPPRVILLMLSLNLLYQFWIHASWIPRLGPLEWILNTPSAHRVHHAANLEYLDGNYGGVLIIFDRVFGTYIPERADLPCRYGLVTPLLGNNLLKIEFSQWRALWQDLRCARSARAFFGFLFKPPGWQPEGPGQTTAELRARAHLGAPTVHDATAIPAAPSERNLSGI